MVPLGKGHHVPFLGGEYTILCAQYVLQRVLADGILCPVLGKERGIASPEGIQRVVKRNAMYAPEAVVQVQHRVEIVVEGLAVQPALFAWGVEFLLVSMPVVLILGGVRVGGHVVVKVCRCHNVQPHPEGTTLHIFHARHQAMALAVLLAIHDVLSHTRLHVLVVLRVGHAEHQAVCPLLVLETEACHYRLVMELVVKPPHPLRFVPVYASRLEVLHGSQHHVVVVRIVLESGKFPGHPPTQVLPQVHACPVRIERAIGVRGIQPEGFPALVRHHVYHSAYGIGAEAHGHHALVYLYALGKVHGYVVKSEGRTHTLLGHTVHEDLHVPSREAVQQHLHLRASTARFPHLHSWSLAKHIAQRLCTRALALGVYTYYIIWLAPCPCHGIGVHHHLLHFGCLPSLQSGNGVVRHGSGCPCQHDCQTQKFYVFHFHLSVR